MKADSKRHSQISAIQRPALVMSCLATYMCLVHQFGIERSRRWVRPGVLGKVCREWTDAWKTFRSAHKDLRNTDQRQHVQCDARFLNIQGHCRVLHTADDNNQYHEQ